MQFTTTAMAERLTILFNKQLKGEILPEERTELLGLFLEPAMQSELQQLVEAAWYATGEEDDMTGERKETILRHIIDMPLESTDDESEKTGTPVISMESSSRKRAGWKRWVAAASVIVLLGIGSYFLFFDKTKSPVPSPLVTTDVEAPATNRAMVTLTNGQTVYLDSVLNGELALQGNIKLVKLANEQIAYETINGETQNEIKYNTLTNPRGSRVIDMKLADGSHVWLNAGSSIRYPIAFTGNERKVEITGEAYFEVAHDKAKPFYVTKNDMQVKVLGTHFNVNVYDDEENIKVTLLEGSVRVSGEWRVASGKATVLRPGQQAVIGQPSSAISINSNVDLDEVMAWKNGRFYFENSSVETIMKQVERWYDVEVEYQDKVPHLFVARIPRDVPVSELLNLLELTGRVHFKIEEKKITVLK